MNFDTFLAATRTTLILYTFPTLNLPLKSHHQGSRVFSNNFSVKLSKLKRKDNKITTVP